MHSEDAIDDSRWDNAWLTPWEAVQLVVSVHPAGGHCMAKLVPEKWVHEDGLAVVFRTLRLRSVPAFDILRNPRALRFRKLRGDRIPMRANRFFREACAKVDKWCRAGRVAGELHPLSGGAPRRVTSEFSTSDLDFERGRLGGARVFLRRTDLVNLCSGTNLLTAELETKPVAPLASKTGRRGRAPCVDWAMVDQRVFDLMEYHDEFTAGDLDWNAQARLERAIKDFIGERFKIILAESTIRAHVVKPLKSWREKRKAEIK